MNEAMRLAWLEISQMLGEPTREELDVFLRTWQRAIQAEREACAEVCIGQMQGKSIWMEGAKACSLAIRARGENK
jgi:hypothetical protein